MKKKHLLPIVVELIGISVVSMAIILEITKGGAIYLIMTTIGSLFITTGGVIWGKFMRQGDKQ